MLLARVPDNVVSKEPVIYRNLHYLDYILVIMAKKKSDHPRAFIEYIEFIVTHDNFKGMPDAYCNSGDVQWATPSNRNSGRFKDSHRKREIWWRRKAMQLGIEIDEGNAWKNHTAKLNHPTKMKPCGICGKIMDLRYSYANKYMIRRIQRLPYFDESFIIKYPEHILILTSRLFEVYGDRILKDLPTLLKTSSTKIPEIEPNLEKWLIWIEEKYIPAEPSLLSPGAMSNVPDRFDGFHNYNLCCRSRADKGRSKENLQSYNTDRRAFEYWVDGDWVAADALMGLIRNKKFQNEPCLNGHRGPCTADHIGPISLGFSHRPEFQFLCRECNSAKNNRMFLSDVAHLRDAEHMGENVASWYCKSLWDLRKDYVVDEETARRLSKLLRDNRYNIMTILNYIKSKGHFVFLSTLLELSYANYDISFENLRVENHITKYDYLNKKRRVTKYATEQKARRLRVAFEALNDYADKEKRNAIIVSSDAVMRKLDLALEILGRIPPKSYGNEDLASLLSTGNPSEEKLRLAVQLIPESSDEPKKFVDAKLQIVEAADVIAKELSDMWTDNRYMRPSIEDDI